MSNEGAWWAKTKGLMISCLILWAMFGLVVHFFVKALNNIVILGFPLGFFMAAQGSLIAFVALVFWFAGRQHAVDREHGVADE